MRLAKTYSISIWTDHGVSNGCVGGGSRDRRQQWQRLEQQTLMVLRRNSEFDWRREPMPILVYINEGRRNLITSIFVLLRCSFFYII